MTHQNTRKDLLQQMSDFDSGLAIYCIGLLWVGKKGMVIFGLEEILESNQMKTKYFK